METDIFGRNPYDRPTANQLLQEHPFCAVDTSFNFHDTTLYAKIKGTFRSE